MGLAAKAETHAFCLKNKHQTSRLADGANPEALGYSVH